MNGCHAARLRCPVCGNPDWHPRAGHEECTHCGLCIVDVAALDEAGRAIEARLAAGRAEGRAGDRWWIDAPGWRNAAWRFGYRLADGIAARAVPMPHAITLAIMTRPSEIADAARLVASLPEFRQILVAIDADDAAPWADRFPTARVFAHPLAGDFAAQRNRLQEAAGAGWVLQLDSDERPDARLRGAFGWLVAAAQDDGLRALGLARCNLVDGEPSTLFPDIQYRLTCADVRFAGRVHERPVVPFAQTSLALAGAIEHRLDRARVLARTQLYAALSPDGARPEDEARLLRPFDPIADR